MREQRIYPGMGRREFLKNAILGIGAIALSGSGLQAATTPDEGTTALDLKITCTTEILRAPGGKTFKMWVPIPPGDGEQEITGLAIDTTMPYYKTQESEWQNKMIFIFLGAGDVKAGDKVALSYRMKRKAVGTISDAAEDPKRYMKPSEWEKWDDAIVKFTDDLVGGETDPVKIGRKVYDAIIDRVTYIHEACGRGVSSFTLEEKVGRCDEFHALFRSMMMYKGIPVKWEQGILLPYPSSLKKTGEFDADCINAHSWAKFYVGGGKWMPVDLSEAKRRPDLRNYYFGRITPNRIKMSTGRGFNLDPKQEGIINTFAYAYAEGDGIPLIYSHHYRNVMRYELVGRSTKGA